MQLSVIVISYLRFPFFFVFKRQLFNSFFSIAGSVYRIILTFLFSLLSLHLVKTCVTLKNAINLCGR